GLPLSTHGAVYSPNRNCSRRWKCEFGRSLRSEEKWRGIVGYERCNEKFVLVFFGYFPNEWPVGGVTPFDPPRPIWCREKAQRTLREYQGEARSACCSREPGAHRGRQQNQCQCARDRSPRLSFLNL